MLLHIKIDNLIPGQLSKLTKLYSYNSSDVVAKKQRMVCDNYSKVGYFRKCAVSVFVVILVEFDKY